MITIFDKKASLIFSIGSIIVLAISFTHSQAQVTNLSSLSFMTVITAEDIRAIGATDLDEVLESVPGLHVSTMFAGNPVYTFRGIYTFVNAQPRLLINGIDMTQISEGNRGPSWAGMPVEAIQRIEVIRGPDSVTYNTPSFSGIINIITKTQADIEQPTAGIRIGSFERRDAWVLGSTEVGGFKVAAILEYHDTEGHKELVNRDYQTFFDEIFGTDASLAPGPVSLERENYDFRLDIARDLWRFRAGLQRRDDIGYYTGTAALDPTLRHASDRWSTDFTYKNPTVNRHWEMEMQLSYFESDWTIPDYDRGKRIFPPGANLGEGPYPDGMIGNPEIWERHYRLNLSSIYKGFTGHRIGLGGGFSYLDMYKIQETKNFGIDPTTEELLTPESPVVDVTDTPYAFLPEKSRRNYYLALHDEWQFAKNWMLSVGVRYDDYSDTKESIDPYLALLWTIHPSLTSRLLYSRASRPPSLIELWNVNNPEHLGNPNLTPETLTSLELGIDYRPTNTLQLGLSLFHSRWEDLIDFVPDPDEITSTAQNIGEQTGQGFELEADWRLNNKLRLVGNYAYQYSEDEENDADAGNAPHHHFYMRSEWRFIPDGLLTAQLNAVMERKRRFDDTRPPVDDYATVDLTLRYKPLKNWEMAVAVRNLLDDDVREPSAGAGRTGTRVPEDFPMAGRNWFAEIRYQF